MKIVTTILALTLILSCPAMADDAPFRIAKFIHFSCSFADYATTHHASRSPLFEEQDIITQLYWRSPPAFCAFKSVEIICQNWLFDTIYKKNKFLGYVTILAFTVVRFLAFRGNMRVMGVR